MGFRFFVCLMLIYSERKTNYLILITFAIFKTILLFFRIPVTPKIIINKLKRPDYCNGVRNNIIRRGFILYETRKNLDLRRQNNTSINTRVKRINYVFLFRNEQSFNGYGKLVHGASHTVKSWIVIN